jgi:hypothetical protein
MPTNSIGIESVSRSSRGGYGGLMGLNRRNFGHMDSGGCLRIAGGPASSSGRRVLPRNHHPLGGQTDAGCAAGAPPGQASPGGDGKIMPCARSFRLTREVTGRAGPEDDSEHAACRRVCARCAGVSCR